MIWECYLCFGMNRIVIDATTPQELNLMLIAFLFSLPIEPTSLLEKVKLIIFLNSRFFKEVCDRCLYRVHFFFFILVQLLTGR